ncbi:LacI family DNA-binding transcriptional regulator [Vibrio ishigakensis]|uniref:LacI family DNA-binding transcriptional regulator n=1 Tax=Vibrio ishigakensis TaxID=1481914 RepID=UPI0021C48FAE|nr:LacI family DNA-binding transcriptional regulator [Vibrio ishigakensis]
MKKKKAPTVYDVAKLAGVSPSTVSRFLNRTTYVSSEKSEKLKKAIRELGYETNQNAVSEGNRRSMTIGVLIQHPDSPFTSRFLNDMEKMLLSLGYSPVIATGHWQRNLENDALDYLVKSNVDGMIIVTGNIEEEKIIQVAQNIPVVAIGYQVKAPNVCSIQFDNTMGGYLATLHLLQQGHVNIAHIKGHSGQPDAINRFEGYKKALAETGIRYRANLVKQGDFSSELGYEKTVELIESNIHFSAIFAANDQTAYGAIKALTDNGYKVPEDVSVVGFDDLPTSQYFTPAITTLRQPIEEVGVICARSIINMLNGDPYETRIPPIDLMVRQSTRSIYEAVKEP